MYDIRSSLMDLKELPELRKGSIRISEAPLHILQQRVSFIIWLSLMIFLDVSFPFFASLQLSGFQFGESLLYALKLKLADPIASAGCCLIMVVFINQTKWWPFASPRAFNKFFPPLIPNGWTPLLNAT